MMQFCALGLALGQILFEEAQNGSVHTRALASCPLANGLIEIWWNITESDGFGAASICIVACIIVMR